MATATSSSQSSRGRQKTSRSKSTTTDSTSHAGAEAQGREGPTVELPFVTAQFHRPDLHLPGQQDVTAAVDTVRSQLPSRDQALFYGGLAAGAAFSFIEWPVAVAIGIGNALVTRNVRQHDAG
ncbi:hypothetical protein [Parasphingorhabdus pacifica]